MSGRADSGTEAILAEERSATHELREVVRVLEKFGLSELLVSAHGSPSPQLAVLRLCEFIAKHNLDVDLVTWARKPPAER